MKKSFAILIISALLIAGAYAFWPKIHSAIKHTGQLAQTIQNNQTIQNISRQVFTGGPLRSVENNPDAFLTKAGVIADTNLMRKQNGGLTALSENFKLDEAARMKLKDIFTKQYFEHVSPQGQGPSDLAQKAGYQYVIIGENLALGNFKNDTALVDAWMNSPGHRANILQPKYLEIGVAVGQGVFEGQKVWVAVQEFWRPASACPEVDETLKSQIDSLKSDSTILMTQLNDLKSQIENLPEPKTRQEADYYNQKVSEYNNVVNLYNNKVDQLKANTAAYNAQVKAFNACSE